MRAASTFLASLSLSLIQPASAAAYTFSKTWSGNDFLSSDWVWYTGNDEANGRVNYVTETVVQQEKLVSNMSCCMSFFLF